MSERLEVPGGAAVCEFDAAAGQGARVANVTRPVTRSPAFTVPEPNALPGRPWSEATVGAVCRSPAAVVRVNPVSLNDTSPATATTVTRTITIFGSPQSCGGTIWRASATVTCAVVFAAEMTRRVAPILPRGAYTDAGCGLAGWSSGIGGSSSLRLVQAATASTGTAARTVRRRMGATFMGCRGGAPGPVTRRWAGCSPTTVGHPRRATIPVTADDTSRPRPIRDAAAVNTMRPATRRRSRRLPATRHTRAAEPGPPDAGGRSRWGWWNSAGRSGSSQPSDRPGAGRRATRSD